MTSKKVESSLFPPIKIKLDGLEYEIKKVPYKLLKKLKKDKETDADAQLSLLTGIPISKIEEFDAREIAYALRRIMKELMNPFLVLNKEEEAQEKEEKNGLKPSEKP
jgi:hypothetical protein